MLPIIPLTVLAFIAGAVFGSFVDCLAWRCVRGENMCRGRSRCDVCGEVLRARDLIPILSHVCLRGRCRYCGAPVSLRHPLTELLLGGAFAAAVLRFGWSWQSLEACGLFAVLLGLSLVDLESLVIPNGFILAGILWWLPTLLLTDGTLLARLSFAMSGSAMAALVLAMVLVFEKLTKQESMGGGDIKLFFMVGLYLGFWQSLLNLILACLAGIAFSLAIGARRIPFGPSIAAATAVTFLWGAPVVEWYLGLF